MYVEYYYGLRVYIAYNYNIASGEQSFVRFRTVIRVCVRHVHRCDWSSSDRTTNEWICYEKCSAWISILIGYRIQRGALLTLMRWLIIFSSSQLRFYEVYSIRRKMSLFRIGPRQMAWILEKIVGIYRTLMYNSVRRGQQSAYKLNRACYYNIAHGSWFTSVQFISISLRIPHLLIA